MKAIGHAILLITVLFLQGGCNQQTDWELAPGIFILDKQSPVESYAELAARLPRKAFYVDHWASWCAPCLKEFTCYDTLRPFLEAHDIEILYLNSDMNLEETKWFDFIREHKLYGYHVRLNYSLQRDLIDQGYFLPLIPQFMIIDSTGSVLDHSAHRPSEGEVLIRQLTETLGLESY
jgi:thiol-disulfide isomerase/thioredoxin